MDGGKKDRGREETRRERDEICGELCKATKKEGYHKDIPLIGDYWIGTNSH